MQENKSIYTLSIYISLRLVTIYRPAKAFNFYCGHPAVCSAIIIIIIIIIKTAIYFKGEIFRSVSRVTWIADNAMRTEESHLDYRVWLQETPI